MPEAEPGPEGCVCGRCDREIKEWLKNRPVYEWAKTQVTVDELDRAAREPGGRPLREILDELKKTGSIEVA